MINIFFFCSFSAALCRALVRFYIGALLEQFKGGIIPAEMVGLSTENVLCIYLENLIMKKEKCYMLYPYPNVSMLLKKTQVDLMTDE